MTISASPSVIGLTGPFGTGCSTAAATLVSRRGYRSFLLSSLISDRWKRKNPHTTPRRADLQALGNEIRRTSGNPGALADLAIGEIERSKNQWSSIVIDGIRNVGEVEVLKERFGQHFYLIALECPQSERWRRLRPTYEKEGLALEDFLRDNEQDRLQEYAHGQQVQLCVDRADVLLRNDRNERKIKYAQLSRKLLEYLDLVSGTTPR